MSTRLKVLFLAAEAEPFIKVGGLGDVAGSLPRHIRGLSPESTGGASADVRLVIPFHSFVRSGGAGLRPLASFTIMRDSTAIPVQVFSAQQDGMPVYILAAEPISEGGSVYSSNPVLDGEKYAFFSMAALELMHRLDWVADIVHANDWHTALACYAVLVRRREGAFPGIATLLTVHNLPFMGPDLDLVLPRYGLRGVKTGLPTWAENKPLAMGLWAADAIVAVSPSYAQEMQTRQFGSGLEEYLRARRESLHGILNGIDTELYNPATDPALAANYGHPTLDRRALNKAALQTRLGLPQDPNALTFSLVSRLDPQKGSDMLASAFRRVADLNWQAVILGTGSPRLESSVKRLEKSFPGRIRAEIRFDAGLARQIYAGADALLMPSRYEPCGLSQMIAMRYGSLPIVSEVGGLRDTVMDGETGFVIGPPSSARLAATLRRVLDVWPEKDLWRKMQLAAMRQDHSWGNSARLYLELYRRLSPQDNPFPVA